jgi:hypothetical protein
MGDELELPARSLRWFEMCVAWPPRLDVRVTLARIPLGGKEFHWFEHTEIYAARVLNASRMGSHTLASIIWKTIAVPMYEFCTEGFGSVRS